MRELINTFISLTCVLTVILSIPVLATTTREYMTVDSVERESGTVVLLAKDGNLWEFTGYGFTVSERVIVDMYDNGTPDYIYDDQIVTVKQLH